MARTTIPLTDTKIKTSKTKEIDYKLFDGGGLYLLVTKAGGKHWKLKYSFNNKEKKLSLGAYPSISLLKARELREIHKIDIANGINPSDKKKEAKVIQAKVNTQHLNTFKAIALQRLEKIKEDISEPHYKGTMRGFVNDTFPYIGDKSIDDVTAQDIISILRKMMERDVRNSTQKVYQTIGKTFKWAVAHGLAQRNPASDIDISEIIGQSKEEHYPTIIDDKGIRNLLTSIKEYGGESSTKYALLFLTYTFVRPTNARLALWSEINIKSKQWCIPAKKMKTKDDFIVPLPDTLISLLEDIKLYSGDSPYLFPSTKSTSTPLSDGALLGAVRRMGYTTTEFTPHGVRAMFSTLAHEKSGFKYDVIETQLAHKVGGKVPQAYNRAKYLNERVELMQWWSNYLEELQK
ncbi:integrase arm-type DNA-binding domain-containing protein [Sulfurimonas sp.]|jgi:integrase|uniref:tyrosine-type recombinase/integrase n=1 Tax=Sulfurimonas sp. TaxID=2022749 RepID=UPI0025D84875|nr:integrase arm-type DNA-binding domain-containing protein [Sulfurimonas sp.]MBT5935087.1 integrase arm-type DNA-binding domain-containing protein [Sulfurimonas sp.]